MSVSSFMKYVPGFLKTWWGISLAVVIVVGGYFFFFSGSKTSYQFVSVTRGPITETVSVTGNTAPTASVSLGFNAAGTIAAVYAAVGDRVYAGSVLAAQNTADLSAQLKQAQATVDAQQAKLDGLTAGSRPEDIASAQAAYDKSVQDLANLYASVSDTASDSYAKGYDAVHVQLSDFFSNPDSASPQLSFSTADSQSNVAAQNARVAAGTALTAWEGELPGLVGASTDAVDAAISKEIAYLGTIRDFLNTISAALNAATSLPSSTQATYKTDVAAALSETNTAIKNLNSASQSIASQKLSVIQLKAQLDLTKAGATVQDIAAQRAQVENAQAAVASLQAKLANAEIVAPISGVVTQFDAKVGQVASSGTPLVSIISAGSFEVDADVPEIDIGKVSLGDSVSMTLDAFPNETFTGRVFYIDPAETVTSGVVNYKVKVSFNTADTRMKSGLTTNLDIETNHQDSTLTLPEYAVLENDQGTFVRVLQGGVATDTPVTLGLRDATGNVEITSGVTEGEKVVNIGLKQ